MSCFHDLASYEGVNDVQSSTSSLASGQCRLFTQSKICILKVL